MTITKEEFINLKEGDKLKNKSCTIEVCIVSKKLIAIIHNNGTTNTYSLQELQENGYSLIKETPNNQGWPIGDYSDRCVFFKTNFGEILRLELVTEDYFTDFEGTRFYSATLIISDYVEMI